MKYSLSRRESESNKRKIIEIVGPAGAGKTTLFRMLGCYEDQICLENFPNVHDWLNAPFYISAGMQLYPHLMRLPRFKSRQLTRREFAWMGILYRWSVLLRKQSQTRNRAIILDQGPIYLMAEMRLFGPEYLKRNAAESFWQDLYERWNTTLDTVILLDGANDILLERIRNREQELVVKDQPALVVYEFLDLYRAEYSFLLSRLAAKEPGLQILRFDTGLLQTQDILNRVLAELASG